MNHRTIRYLLLGQLSLVVLLMWCYFLDPALVRPNRGFSNYGVLSHTSLIYAAAFALCAWFVGLAASSMPSEPKAAKWLTQMLWVLVFWIIAIWLTTYLIFTGLGWTHKLVVVLAFVFELVVAGEIALLWMRQWAMIGLLALEIVGVLIATLSNFHTFHLLFIGQLITQVAFAPLITLTAWNLTKSVAPDTTKMQVKPAQLG